MGEPKGDDPGSSSSGQPPRQRAAHKRSRTGCSTCKKRHIRCDESKPICTKCLVKGTDCHYNDDSYPTTPSPASRSSTPYTPPDPLLFPAHPLAWQSPPAPTPLHPDREGHVSINLPFNSHEILQHSNNYRQAIAEMMPAQHRAGTPAAREPLHVHTMVLWACLHRYFQQSCSMDSVLEQTCLHHKVEMMKTLKQQQHHHAASTVGADYDENNYDNDTYAGAILCLAVVEAAMDSAEAAATHLRGLFAVVDASTIMRQGAESQSSSQMLPHLALIILSLLSKARPSSVQQSSSAPFSNPETPLFHRQPDDPTRLQPRYFTPERAAVDMNDSVPPKAYAAAAHLLVHAIAGRTRGDINTTATSTRNLQILHWLLHSPGQQHSDGGSNPQLWLWKTVLSAYALVTPDLALPATAPIRVWLGHQVERWKRSGSTQVQGSVADAVLTRLGSLLEEPGPGSGRSCLRALCYEADAHSRGV
ncbi:hypothetical protein PspLS_11024 [Pyricularia sp. CBS 133598]|nr:hypothetical protein PspLS_11024 [Pyricularia sp. CBS 133598]